MFDIAWSELALIGAVALVVIGPKDLPKVMRTLGQWTRKARLLAGEFQHNVEDMIRQAELDEVRRQVRAANPAGMKNEIESMIDAKGIKEALTIDKEALTIDVPAGGAASSTAGSAEPATPAPEGLPPAAQFAPPAAAQHNTDKPAEPQP